MPTSRERLEELIKAAKEASRHAHAPYTNLHVGAAVLTGDNKIYVGCNVENAAPPITMCATRNAIGAAVANGSPDIELVVIYTPTNHATPPCGACRQVINELSNNAHVYCLCQGTEVIHRRVGDLLPDAFGPQML
jgi:cytidine deaminase